MSKSQMKRLAIQKPVEEQSLMERLRIRAEIRRRIRPEGDRIADLCDEAADRIEELEQILRWRDMDDEDRSYG